MNNSVKTRPQRRLTQAELGAFLANAADLLRGGVDHSEFRGYVFALSMLSVSETVIGEIVPILYSARTVRLGHTIATL